MSTLVTRIATAPEATAPRSAKEDFTTWAIPSASSGWYPPFKIAFEFIFSALLLVAVSPLILAAGLLVKLTSRGPIFYSQIRLGRGGKPFWIHKLRTMSHNCESQTGACWATPNDPRVTRVGRVLRTLHLDELPQLWNVLQGDMSLIGPRPERPEFVPNLEKAIPHYRDRLLVRPGVTGLAQVQLPADSNLDSVRRKLAYDLYYIRQMSFWLDLKLIFCTAVHVLGVPYRMVGRLFRLPGPERVEQVSRQQMVLAAAQ